MSDLTERYRFVRYIYVHLEKRGYTTHIVAFDRLINKRVILTIDEWYDKLRNEKCFLEDCKE